MDHPLCRNGHEMTPENTGSRNRCLVCRRDESKAFRERNHERLLLKEAAYREANRESIRAWHRQYRLDHPDRLKASYKRTYERHREKILAAATDYRARNKARIRERDQTRNAAYYEAHREERRAYRKRYEAAHPEKTKQRCAKRRAIKRGTRPGNVSYRNVMKQPRCGICGLKFRAGDRVHVDHIVPLSKGGKHEEANLQKTHAICNQKKGTKMPINNAGAIYLPAGTLPIAQVPLPTPSPAAGQ